MRIRKLRELANKENFLQINYKKGYKYIDKAGEILNLYDDKMTAYSVDARQLLIQNPSPTIQELKVSTTDFWVHFSSLKSFNSTHSTDISNQFVAEAKKALRIIKPGNVTRLGWRSYLILELPTKVVNLSKHSAANSVEVTYSIRINTDVDSNFSVKLLEKRDDSTKSAILFDIDVFMERNVEITKLQLAVKELSNAYLGGVFVQRINDVLESIDGKRI